MHTAAIVRRAEFEVLADLETWADWINTASEEREPSVYFNGGISTAELIRIANGCPVKGETVPTSEQQIAARDEVKRRYLDDKVRDIRDIVARQVSEAEAFA